MFVSLPPWAVARKVGWPEQARLAARVGYAGIDWAFGPARTAGVEATRALLAELGIRATIVNLPMQGPLDGDDGAFEAQLPKLGDDAAFCAAIGCRSFQLVLRATTGGPSKEERWKVVRDRLAAISEVLAKHDVRLGLEFLGPLVFRARARAEGAARDGAPVDPNAPPPPPPAPPVPFVWTLTETISLRGEWPEPRRHARRVALVSLGRHGRRHLATPSSRIIHVHVSDARQMPPEEVQDNMRLLPGEGIIDLGGILQGPAADRLPGSVAPETIGPGSPTTCRQKNRRLALEKTGGVMKKAGAL